MRLLVSILALLILLGAACVFVYYYWNWLLVWFGVVAPQPRESSSAEEGGAVDGTGQVMAKYQKSSTKSSSQESFGTGSNNSAKASPVVVVVSDDACRGELLSYKTVAKGCNNWAQDRILGRGGMATVYRADLPQFGQVAVKRFQQEKDGSGRDFFRELDALCQCRHPHILEIIGRTEDGPEKIIVMPLMEGGTFGLALPQMPWTMRTSILGQVIHAISFLHGKNIIHRDIKTSNILLDRPLRHARLADFGLAKDRVHASHHGTTGIVVGSPGYMAPELMMRPANEKTDAFAAGVVFLEILTRLPAWDADHQGGMALTDRVVVDSSFQNHHVDMAAGWPAQEVAIVSQQAIGLTLFDPGRRLTVLQVEQDTKYAAHLKRADTLLAKPSPKTIGLS